ncbi:MAG TPA: phytase [Croceibacterium sp.]|nr:phytase [Croceibacterium sp.]
MARLIIAAMLGAALAACTPAVSSLPVADVTASGETDPVGTSNADAADDPAIWRNPADPAASLIVATDKKAGLYVYGLGGKSRFFDPSGRLNNVDLAELPDGRVIVVASDRNDPLRAKLMVWQLDTATPKLVPLGAVDGGAGEAYGVCLWAAPDGLHAFSVLKDGTIEEYRLAVAAGAARSEHLLTRKLATQTEGCVADPRGGTFYVGEEDVGVWRFAAGAAQGRLVAEVDDRQLVADTEGLALWPEGADGGYLVVSSQGDNTYALYALPGMEPAGRFRIAAGTYGSTEETDGIAIAPGDFGPLYPEGLFVAQDGENAPRAQNFKLVSWKTIRDALSQR